MVGTNLKRRCRGRNKSSRNTYRGLILEKVHILRGALSVLKAASSAGCEMLKARRRNG